MNFKEYLMDRFMDEEPHILDDDLPDAFDAWMEMDIEEIIDHADLFAEQKVKESKKQYDHR